MECCSTLTIFARPVLEFCSNAFLGDLPGTCAVSHVGHVASLLSVTLKLVRFLCACHSGVDRFQWVAEFQCVELQMGPEAKYSFRLPLTSVVGLYIMAFCHSLLLAYLIQLSQIWRIDAQNKWTALWWIQCTVVFHPALWMIGLRNYFKGLFICRSKMKKGRLMRIKSSLFEMSFCLVLQWFVEV